MKTIPPILAACALVFSCKGSKESDSLRAQLNEANNKITSLERDIAKLRRTQHDAPQAQTGHSQSSGDWDKLNQKIEVMKARSGPYSPLDDQAHDDDTGTTGDLLKLVPQQASDIIQRVSAQKWKNNLRMRGLLIEAMAGDWLDMDDRATREAEGVPSDVRDSIVATAKKQNPLDFSQQITRFDMDIESWKKVADFEKNGVPGVSAKESAEILEAAKNKWPDNWNMRLFSIEHPIVKKN